MTATPPTAAARGEPMDSSRTLMMTATVGVLALLSILALWHTVDTEACAASELDIAHCTAAVDGR